MHRKFAGEFFFIEIDRSRMHCKGACRQGFATLRHLFGFYALCTVKLKTTPRLLCENWVDNLFDTAKERTNNNILCTRSFGHRWTVEIFL